MRQRIASEQAAMHRVQLAVARWRGARSTAPCQTVVCQETLSQARWNDAAQDHFVAWLEGGGFAAELDIESAADSGMLVDGLYPERPCRCAV